MVKGKQKVCVIGLWHQGLVTSACLADLGYTVVGVDKNKERVADLNKGIPPLLEPGLPELLRSNLDSLRLSYTSDLAQAVEGAHYVLIAFDTPVDEEDEISLTEIFDTSVAVARHLKYDSLVLVSSQVPVGTCEKIESLIRQNNPALRFDIAYSPENLRLGKAIGYWKNPDRIVIGANSKVALDKAETLFNDIKGPKLRMNLRTAEMTKHALNCFLATAISFGNEIGNLCDEVGADAVKVVQALQSDTRIGYGLPLQPGLGFGGGTLARDLKILRKLGEKSGCETRLVDSVLEVNRRQMTLVTTKLQKIYSSLKDLKVGILGLTYKAGTSTLRRSAAIEVIKSLVSEGAIVRAYDPGASLEEVQAHQEFEFCADPYAVARGSDAMVITTDWPEFKNLDFDLFKSLMKRPVLIDTKNMLDSDWMRAQGFVYLGVGRGRE
jgi:UDPglucose 6-dehydrogenase